MRCYRWRDSRRVREPNWRFRRPASLDELAAFVQFELETINTLFMSSDSQPPISAGKSRSRRSRHLLGR